jgi:mycothiol system anti-sigma-R factor
MQCDDVKRSAYFFLDGSLSEARRQDLETHLSTCADCDARILIHRRLRRMVRCRLPDLTAPDSLRTRLSRSLRFAAAE